MSDYRDLQKRAGELGIKAVGVSKEELEAQVAEAETNLGDQGQAGAEENSPSDEGTSETKNENKKASKSSKKDADLAIVMDGGREARRYSVRQHGKKFEKLAHEYADNRGFVVVLDKEKEGMRCPHCGEKFIPA